MLLDFLLNMFFEVLSFFLSLFPDANTTFIVTVTSAINNFRSFISQVNFIVPIETIFSVAVAWFIYKQTFLGTWSINWIINKLRGSG